MTGRCSNAFHSVLKHAYHPIGIQYSDTMCNNNYYTMNFIQEQGLAKSRSHALVCEISRSNKLPIKKIIFFL